jgi:hypothetical protein
MRRQAPWPAMRGSCAGPAETRRAPGEGGVPEYWLLDPQLEQAEFYQLDAQGRYQVVAPDDNGMYHAQVVAGFWLRVAWLWRQPLPDPVQVLLEIDRDAYMGYLHNRIQQASS